MLRIIISIFIFISPVIFCENERSGYIESPETEAYRWHFGGGFEILIWIVCIGGFIIGFIGILYWCNRVNAEIHERNLEEVVVDQNLEEVVVDQNSGLHGPALWANLEAVDPIIVDQEALVQPSQPVIIQNTESSLDKNQEINDLPTFDEALKMEIVKMDKSQSKARRRLSSRLSKTNDELPDYETHESHPEYF